ncbi:L,D-transpeptidase [Haloechinothrix salitolerans]|uniref:L,D-transpeptidase n=1 Tax=Haloechinothrix salitolerans TaxID=926830 RepID=A0ABW2C202_9PSEU
MTNDEFESSNGANAPAANDASGRGWKFILISAGAGVLAVALVLGGVMWFSSGTAGDPQAAPREQTEAASEVDLAALTESTTHTKLDNAPIDPAPQEVTDGTVVHPKQMTKVYDAPNGTAFAKIGPKQLGDTWLPVIATQDGWSQVLLPSKPNGASGWISDDAVVRDTTPYLIRVHLGSRTIELRKDGEQLGSWPIGIGKEETPTPTGRTFLLGSFVDPNQDFSPVILPLGSHSETLDTFGGGPGTVAIHTWPTSDVFGTRSSHGCIQVPKDALNRLTEVPLGTLVLVDQH